MLNSVEKSLKKHVVLLLVSKLSFTGSFECAHQFAELFFLNFSVPICVALQVFDKGSKKAVLCLLIISIVYGSLKQIFYERCNVVDPQEVVSVEMKQKCAEYIFVGNSVL